MDLGTGPSPEPISHHNKPAENRKAGRNGTTEQRAAPVWLSSIGYGNSFQSNESFIDLGCVYRKRDQTKATNCY
eukprot:scaffold16273_cov85-Cylindrotheca_fusiformis.AAC.1